MMFQLHPLITKALAGKGYKGRKTLLKFWEEILRVESNEKKN